jgi:MscS family membrane protein
MNGDFPDGPRFSFSYKRATRVCAGASTLALVLLFSLPVSGQLGNSSSTPVPSQPAVPQDSLGRTTPRGAVLGFLTAARKGDDDLAARYLNTPRRGKAATDLAHQLFVVLDRRLPARLNTLSGVPEGSDLLKPNQELVGTISSDNGNVDISVERVDRGKSGSLWLFSSETLEAIPDLYEQINVTSADNVLPGFLVNTRFAGIPLFEWLAVFVGIPLFYFLAALLNRVLSRLMGLLRRRLHRKPSLPNLQFLPRPIRVLLLAAVIRWLLTKLSLPLLARQFWLTIASVFTIAGCVWLLVILDGRVEAYIRRRLLGHNRTGATSILRLARRTVDVLVIFAGTLVALYHFGVNPTAALAGLGVGGIAVALAAQKTLENVIGGVSIIFDRAVNVGNFLKVGDTLGTVDEIGLRSTRIRTLDRTVVSVPNGQIANLSLENFSARDKFWFHPILNLSRGTTSPQMYAVLESIRGLLKESRSVEADLTRVRFIRVGPYSLDVEVFAYILARDWNQFLELQEAFLLRIMECVESAGVQIALPSQTVFLNTASPSTEPGVDGTFSAPAPSNKTMELAATSA